MIIVNLIAATTDDYHNIENNMIPQAILKTDQRLDSVICSINHTHKVVGFPIMPFKASTIKEVKDKVEIELLGKAEYNDFVFSRKFNKEDDKSISFVTTQIEQ